MYVWCKPAAASVFKHTRMWPEDCATLSLHSARNMVVSGQICLRQDDKHFTITGVDFSDLPQGMKAEYHFTDYLVYNDGVPQPDIISTKSSVDVLMNATQTIVVSFRVGYHVMPATYTVTATVHTSLADFEATFGVSVHPVTLPEPKDSIYGLEYFLNPMGFFPTDVPMKNPPVTPFYPHVRYDEGWWALMGEFAAHLKDMRVNSLHIPLMSLLCDGGSRRVGDGEWQFEFDLFDQFVEFFMAHGSFKYLAIPAIIGSVYGKTMQCINENSDVVWIEVFSPEGDAWAEAFYSAIYHHFEDRGWLPMLLMRLQDEPHSPEYWQWAKEKCRLYMPGVVCGEPLDTHSVARQLAGYCDQYIPRLEVYEEGADFYLERQRAGDQVWCYSCCFPEEMGWMNKFMDWPCSHSRLIHWACFSHGITGFLHWGFNYWGHSLYGIHPDARYKGDGFIVYPDVENNGLMDSIRGINTRDGMQDWELLHLLEQKNPTAAHAIARRIAKAFNDIHTTDLELEAARAEVLSLLS